MPFVKQVIWYKNSPRNLGSKKERFDDIFEKGREKGTNESRTVGTTFYEIPKQWYLRHAKVDYIYPSSPLENVSKIFRIKVGVVRNLINELQT